MERIRVLLAKVAIDAANREVHVGQTPRGVVGLLPVHADVANLSAVCLHKLFGLNEHAARPTARVINPPLVRGQHLDEKLHYVSRRIELAAQLALGTGELGKEVFVNATQHIFRPVLGAAERGGTEDVDELTQPCFIQPHVGVVLGEHTFEGGVLPLDGKHCVVHGFADRRLFGIRLNLRPSRLGRNPEDVLRPILIGILRVGAF